MADFYLYEGRHGERILTPTTRANWDFLIVQLETDCRCTIAESIADGQLEGSYEEGWLYIDDGGVISSIDLTVAT